MRRAAIEAPLDVPVWLAVAAVPIVAGLGAALSRPALRRVLRHNVAAELRQE